MEGKEPFDFITHTVKERPLNKRKLMRKTMITVMMAVIFGLIASFTFLLLQPVISNYLYPEEEIEQIYIPAAEEEILPEEMVEHEQEILGSNQELVDRFMNEFELGTEDYLHLQREVKDMAKKILAAKVMIGEEGSSQTTGFIFSQNNAEVLIFTKKNKYERDQKVKVVFSTKKTAEGYVKETDINTELAVVAVGKEELAGMEEELVMVSLGSSQKDDLSLTPVLALGSPMGNDSIMQGMITGKDKHVQMADSNYQLIKTDMYGDTEAFGIIIDYYGKIVGIIDQRQNKTEVKNRISALGITELKSVLQRMGNGIPAAYVGVKVTDMPEEIRKEKNVPAGAYVSNVLIGSPAMQAGILSGDIIVKIDQEEIISSEKYRKAVMESSPGEMMKIKLMRQGPDGYVEVSIELMVEEQK